MPDQKTTHHLQQLGDFLRVAGGAGSDAEAEAVDGRAKAMQLDVVGFVNRVESIAPIDAKRPWHS